MSADAFAQQVEQDAIACGWTPDLAALLAKHASKPQPRDARSGPRQQRSPVGHAPAPSLDRALTWFGLPSDMAPDFRAAGLATAQAAAPMLRKFLAASVRSPAAAASALQMHLLNRMTYAAKARA